MTRSVRETILEDFARAVDQLGQVLSQEASTDVVRAGCIQYFEFSFELAWKTIRSRCLSEGLNDCNSPRSALKQAFSMGWIGSEEVWLQMLADRNVMSHTYSAENALRIFDNLSTYLEELETLVSRLAEQSGTGA